MGLYKNIQDACRVEGRTVNGVEQELGFGRGSIAKWDKNIPSVKKVAEVAAVLHTTVDALLSGVEFDG